MTCANKEQALDWNQTGPTGAQGPLGPAGPSGTASVRYVHADYPLASSDAIGAGAYCGTNVLGGGYAILNEKISGLETAETRPRPDNLGWNVTLWCVDERS